MNYRYALEDSTYEDLSSGRVLYNRYGFTAFPVRLASEIFQWGKHYLTGKGNAGPYRLYDPCCGGGYLLASLGFLHGGDIRSITASDVDPSAAALAFQNLSLLTPQGLQQRIGQILQLLDEYGKDSHKAALESAQRLARVVERLQPPPSIECFEADATRPPDRPNLGMAFDMIVTDLPYGHIVEWKTASRNPVELLLDNAAALLAPVSLIAVVSGKELKIAHDRYRRAGHWTLGKRRITILELKTESIL